mgnify:CR=1 FL=1
MDGHNMADNQKLTDKGAGILARVEADMDLFLTVLGEAGDAPFGDEKCNRQFGRMRRRWHRVLREVRDFHEDLTECVREGDDTVNFGGK